VAPEKALAARGFRRAATRSETRAWQLLRNRRLLGLKWRRQQVVRGFIVVQSHRPERTEVTRELVEHWYRQRAHAKFAERLEVNLLRFPAPEDFRPKGLIVRQLRQRWGSMSPAYRLLLNRRLIEAPMDAIDYVITHELCHIEVPHHGPEYFALLDRVLPDWQKRKHRLEQKMA